MKPAVNDHLTETVRTKALKKTSIPIKAPELNPKNRKSDAGVAKYDQHHGGGVSLESELDSGSVFTLSLPLKYEIIEEKKQFLLNKPQERHFESGALL